MSEQWPARLPEGWLQDKDRAEVERDARLVALLERYLCPCDPNPATIDGPQRECPVHGDPDVAGPAVEWALTFMASVFRRGDYDAGVRWGREVASTPETLTEERANQQAGHYAHRVETTAVMLSRMLGRLAGYQAAAADRLEGEGRPADRYRLPHFTLVTDGLS